VAAEEDQVHFRLLRGVDANEDIQEMGKRPITQKLATVAGQNRFNPTMLVFLITVVYIKIH